MASSLSLVSCFQPRSGFSLGDRFVFKVSTTPFAQVGFSRKTIKCKESRIGKQPIVVPSNVTIALQGQELKVKGPLGELALTYPPEVELIEEDSGFFRVRKTVETKLKSQPNARLIQGPKTLTDNMVVGVSKGFEKILWLRGTGYRAAVQGKELVLNIGFSYPIIMEIPDSLKVKVEEKTRIIVSGYDKSEIGQFAATIRNRRPAEPYKGIGVWYSDEIIHRKKGKDGKIKKLS